MSKALFGPIKDCYMTKHGKINEHLLANNPSCTRLVHCGISSGVSLYDQKYIDPNIMAYYVNSLIDTVPAEQRKTLASKVGGSLFKTDKGKDLVTPLDQLMLKHFWKIYSEFNGKDVETKYDFYNSSYILLENEGKFCGAVKYRNPTHGVVSAKAIIGNPMEEYQDVSRVYSLIIKEMDKFAQMTQNRRFGSITLELDAYLPQTLETKKYVKTFE